MAALTEAQDDDGWLRHDYSLEAWRSGARPPGPLVAAWRATMPVCSNASRPRLDDAELLELFEQLEEATERPRIVFRFVLALLLCRRRILRYEGTKTTPDGSAILVRQVKAVDAPAAVVLDPGLDDAAIAEATEELASVLFGKAGASP